MISIGHLLEKNAFEVLAMQNIHSANLCEKIKQGYIVNSCLGLNFACLWCKLKLKTPLPLASINKLWSCDQNKMEV